MKVNDLEESELTVYAHLPKLLSKSEMNDICMRLYDTWRSVQKNVSQYGKWIYSKIKHENPAILRHDASVITFFGWKGNHDVFNLFFFFWQVSVMTLLAI